MLLATSLAFYQFFPTPSLKLTQNLLTLKKIEKIVHLTQSKRTHSVDLNLIIYNFIPQDWNNFFRKIKKKKHLHNTKLYLKIQSKIVKTQITNPISLIIKYHIQFHLTALHLLFFFLPFTGPTNSTLVKIFFFVFHQILNDTEIIKEEKKTIY